MNRIKLMVNGLPGNMATNVVKHALKDNRFELIPQSLTGPEITDTETTVESTTFSLIQPQDREQGVTACLEVPPMAAENYPAD
jgi:4-hydroxy-tetrahydrodipicolinate reductase